MAGGYFYNTVTGNVAIEHGVTGVLSDIEAKLGISWVGPFATFGDVQAYATSHHDPPPTLNESAVGQVGNVASSAAQAGAGAISSTVFGPLYQKNIWVRAGEVILGILLIGIGVNAMLKGKPLQVITAPVAALGKAVP